MDGALEHQRKLFFRNGFKRHRKAWKSNFASFGTKHFFCMWKPAPLRQKWSSSRNCVKTRGVKVLSWSFGIDWRAIEVDEDLLWWGRACAFQPVHERNNRIPKFFWGTAIQLLVLSCLVWGPTFWVGPPIRLLVLGCLVWALNFLGGAAIRLLVLSCLVWGPNFFGRGRHKTFGVEFLGVGSQFFAGAAF